MAYIGMAYIVMAYIVMAYMVIAYIVMAYRDQEEVDSVPLRRDDQHLGDSAVRPI